METTTQNGRYLMATLTGSTCGFACWQAHEEVCRCSCGGANHGILRQGGCQPQRTTKIDGQFYELVGIQSRAGHDCYATFDRECMAEVRRIMDERFPDIDCYAYGNYRAEKTLPVVDRKISASQMKWPEVQAIQGALRLIWARPVGSDYRKKSERKAA